MKRKKRLITGQRLSILFIAIALIATTLITLVIMKLIKNKVMKSNMQNIQKIKRTSILKVYVNHIIGEKI